MDRVLNSGDGSSILLDENGNEYDAYSLAWRYLGMYMDCDAWGYDGFSRKLESGDGDSCDRIVLWALYHDPGYQGDQIGEYQFFDPETKSWDRSTCKTSRCARLDCHESRSRYKLLGVYKESDGLVDWAEQLFKHQGYCLWDGNKYEFMQEQYEKWPQECTQMEYTYDRNGGNVYLHMKPQAKGDITYGFYSDSSCSQASTYTIEKYIIDFYAEYANQGSSRVISYHNKVRQMNEYLNVYKICQPCRAYNLYKGVDDDAYGDDGSGDRRHRKLEGDDGEGDDEMWGYNCYDDAGYTNCHQCYKFQSKTDMEEASADDLMRASGQGTILEITVDGVKYGRGAFGSLPEYLIPAVLLVLGATIVAIFVVARRYKKGPFNPEKRLLPSLKDGLINTIQSSKASFEEKLGATPPSTPPSTPPQSVRGTPSRSVGGTPPQFFGGTPPQSVSGTPPQSIRGGIFKAIKARRPQTVEEKLNAPSLLNHCRRGSSVSENSGSERSFPFVRGTTIIFEDKQNPKSGDNENKKQDPSKYDSPSLLEKCNTSSSGSEQSSPETSEDEMNLKSGDNEGPKYPQQSDFSSPSLNTAKPLVDINENCNTSSSVSDQSSPETFEDEMNLKSGDNE